MSYGKHINSHNTRRIRAIETKNCHELNITSFMMQFPCSYIVLALGQMVGCHSNWSLPSGQGVEKESASFLRIFHIKIESIRFFLRVYILKVKFQGAVGSMFLDMWGKMGCREREWSLHDGDGESGAFPLRFLLQPSCGFSVVLSVKIFLIFQQLTYLPPVFIA